MVMLVAKSFQNMRRVGQPFVLNGRTYVKVQNPNTGTERQVRCYTPAEYYRMYPEDRSNLEIQKKVLGFDKGYITIFKGAVQAHTNWFELSNARYCRHWGWYIVSTEEVPSDIPEGITTAHLSWSAAATQLQ